jgi:hypothetical protein
MKARVVAADAPRHALAVWAVVFAGMMQVGAALVPELVTSTGPKGGVAVVAGPGGQGSSRGGESVAEARVWKSGPRHGRRLGALGVRHVSRGGERAMGKGKGNGAGSSSVDLSIVLQAGPSAYRES